MCRPHGRAGSMVARTTRSYLTSSFTPMCCISDSLSQNRVITDTSVTSDLVERLLLLDEVRVFCDHGREGLLAHDLFDQGKQTTGLNVERQSGFLDRHACFISLCWTDGNH